MYVVIDMKKRAYEMRSRGVATAATHDAIINAAVETFMAERSFAITLGPVAKRAGVTVKTVLRHFGSRDALIEAAYSRLHSDFWRSGPRCPMIAKPRLGCLSPTTSGAAT